MSSSEYSPKKGLEIDETPPPNRLGSSEVDLGTATEDLVEEKDFSPEAGARSEIPLKYGVEEPKPLSPDVELINRLEIVVERLFSPDNKNYPRLWTRAFNEAIVREMAELGFTVDPKRIPYLLSTLGLIRFKVSRSTDPKKLGLKERKALCAQRDFMAERVRQARQSNWPVLALETKKHDKPGDYLVAKKKAAAAVTPGQTSESVFTAPTMFKAPAEFFYRLVAADAPVVTESDLDEAAFALVAILGWWRTTGANLYPSSDGFLLLVNGGAVTGYGAEPWQVGLRALANDLSRDLIVCHTPLLGETPLFPSSRLFSFYSTNWRGQSPGAFVTTVRALDREFPSLSASPNCWVDHLRFCLSREVGFAEFNKARIRPLDFHGDMNYAVRVD